ncbi:hypothetical protein MRX96_032788 [Rhipicephalus microplus]
MGVEEVTRRKLTEIEWSHRVWPPGAKYASLKHLYPVKNVSIFGVAFVARPMLRREAIKAGECLGLTKRGVE